MNAKTATPMTDALLREFQPANTDRELDLARLGRKLESDRARLIMALDHLIECVTRPELFRAELDSARLLLRELEGGK